MKISHTPKRSFGEAAALSGGWTVYFIIIVAMVVPPTILIYVQPECNNTETATFSVPLLTWIWVHNGIWLALALFAIIPYTMLLSNMAAKDYVNPCCYGISVAGLLVFPVVLFGWGILGAVLGGQEHCTSAYLAAYTALDILFSITLAIWVPIQLCVGHDCCCN